MIIETVPREKAFAHLKSKPKKEKQKEKEFALETKKTFNNGIPFVVFKDIPVNMLVDLASEGDKVQIAGETGNFYFDSVLEDGSIKVHNNTKKSSYWLYDAVALCKPKENTVN